LLPDRHIDSITYRCQPDRTDAEQGKSARNRQSSSSSILQRAPAMPPCAATVCLSVGKVFVAKSVLSPGDAIPKAAGVPAPPAPRSVLCSMSSSPRVIVLFPLRCEISGRHFDRHRHAGSRRSRNLLSRGRESHQRCRIFRPCDRQDAAHRALNGSPPDSSVF